MRLPGVAQGRRAPTLAWAPSIMTLCMSWRCGEGGEHGLRKDPFTRGDLFLLKLWFIPECSDFLIDIKFRRQRQHFFVRVRNTSPPSVS